MQVNKIKIIQHLNVKEQQKIKYDKKISALYPHKSTIMTQRRTNNNDSS